GLEDQQRSWGDPAVLAGVVAAWDPGFPLAARYEYVAFGEAARICPWCDTLPAFWYQHTRFQGGWRAGDDLLGHPLGGYGSQHRIGLRVWAPGRGLDVEAWGGRLRRDRWNLLEAALPGAAWTGGARLRWRRTRLELRARADW